MAATYTKLLHFPLRVLVRTKCMLYISEIHAVLSSKHDERYSFYEILVIVSYDGGVVSRWRPKI
jgi:hypothetical protein